jgi:hypothetical protein
MAIFINKSFISGLLFANIAFFCAHGFSQTTTVTPSEKQSPATTVDMSGHIGDVLTERASKVLSRYISVNDFYVTSSVKVNSANRPDLPYLPAAQTSDALQSMSNDELNAMIGSVNIDIWLSKKFDDGTKATLVQLVQSHLGLKNAEAITLKDMQITSTISADGASEKLLQKAQDDLRQAMTELKALERERNDLKMSNLLKSNEKDAKADGTPDAAGSGSSKTNGGASRDSMVEQLLAASPAIAGIILIAIVLMIVGRAFSSSIRTIGSGMSSVAEALSTMGGNIRMNVDNEEADIKTPKDAPSASAQSGTAAAQSGPQASGGNIHERILRLNDEIAANMSERTESIILTALTDMLQKPDTVAKAVATMELLGKEKSNQLFKRLGKHSRETVLDFLQTGDYGRSKTELMLEAGEAIKTKLLAEGFGNLRGEMTIKMTEKMLALSEADYYDIFMSLNDQLKPRFMFYLDSEALGRLLTVLGQKNPDKIETVMEMLSKVADVESSVEMDGSIIAAIDSYLGGRKEDVQEKYVPYYQKILETMDGELAEKAVDKLSDKSHVLRAQLKGFVITVNTLFKLPADTRMSMLENLNNKQLASIICCVAEDQAAIVWESVSRRRVELIKDEVDLLKQMAPAAMRAVFGETKTFVINKLKKMRDAGELNDVLDQDVAVTSSATPLTLGTGDDVPDFSAETLPEAALAKLKGLGFTDAELKNAQTLSASQNISHLQALEDMGKVDSRALIDGLSQALNCPVVHLEDKDLQKAILDLIPADVARSLRVIPIERSANNLIVATGRPLSQTLVKALSARTNYLAKPVLASEYRINEALQKYYGENPGIDVKLGKAS